MKNIIVYHSNCLDGVFSAGIIYKFLQPLKEEMTFIPMQYEEGFDLNLLDKETKLWIVDFSFPLEIMKEMNERCGKIVWFDHHISSESKILIKEYITNFEYDIDMTHSGAYITWRNLFKDQFIPEVILLVEDRDLWRFRYPNTRDFTEAMHIQDLTPQGKITQELLNEIEVPKKYFDQGSILRKAKERRIIRAINHGYYGEIKGHKAFFVNSTEDISDIGERIYLMHTEPIVAVIFMIDENVIRFSLRSNTINVEEIARQFKGGGHVGAAGFTLSLRLREVEKLLR